MDGPTPSDPPLTHFGRAQCETLKHSFPAMERITHILCSPMTRTLQTALCAFEPVLRRGVAIEPWQLLREVGSGPASTVEELRTKFDDAPIEWENLEEDWHEYRHPSGLTYCSPGPWSEIRKTLYEYGQFALRNQPKEEEGNDIEILVVSHGGAIRRMVGGRESFAL